MKKTKPRHIIINSLKNNQRGEINKLNAEENVNSTQREKDTLYSKEQRMRTDLLS